MQYDGSIRINTNIITKGAKESLSSLAKAIVGTANRISALRARMEELEKQKTPTEEYQTLDDHIKNTEASVGRLTESMHRMEESGLQDTDVYRDTVSTIEEMNAELERSRARMQELVDTGRAFEFGSDSEEYRHLQEEIDNEEKALKKLVSQYRKLAAKEDMFSKIEDSARKAKESISSMAERLKNLALSVLIFKKLGEEVGSFVETIEESFENFYGENDRFKNSVDSLKASVSTLKNAFEAAFAPLVQMAIPYIQKAIECLTLFLDKVGQVIAAITWQKTYTKAIKQTTAAIKDQNKAQNRQLSSLDKLNNLTSNKGVGDDGEAGGMFEEVPVDKGILDFLQRIKDLLKPLIEYAQKLKDVFMQGFWDGLGDWEYRWESIKASIASIKESLIDIWTDPSVISAGDNWAQSVAYLLGSIAGSVTSVGLTIATNLIGGMAKYLEQNKERIKGYLVSMFDIWSEINQVFSELFQSIAYVFEAFSSEQGQQLTANIIGIFSRAAMGIGEIASKLFRDIANMVIQPFTDNKEGFREALEGFLGILSEVTGTIKQGIDETFDKLNEVYDEHFKPFFDSIASGLSDTVGKFLEMWNTHIQPILDRWAEKFDVLWKDHLQPMLNNFMELLGSLADLLKWLWEEVLKPQLDWFITVLGPTIGDICDFVFSVVDTTIALISDLINGIVQIVKGVIDVLVVLLHGDWQRVWDGFAEVIAGVETTVKGIVNSIIGVVEALANGVVAAVNTVIRAINSIDFSVPSWIPGIGGNSFSPNLPEIPNVSIPRLATGAVIPANKEFMAVLGDQKHGRNLEAPEDLIRKIVREESSGGGVREITVRVPVEVDGNVLFELIKKLDAEQWERTKRPSFQM